MNIKKMFLKNKAILLRQDGYSYSLIKDKIGVSKTTLCSWLKFMPFTPNKATLLNMGKGRLKASEKLIMLREKRLLEAKKLAKSEIGLLSKRDLMLLGIGLYIGEGAKYHKGFVQFSNSDPKVIRLIMSWFIEILKIDIQNFYLIVHAYPDNNIQDILKFWANLTNVPINQFGKTYIDRRTNKRSKNIGKSAHGTLHIRIRKLSEEFSRIRVYNKLLSWIDIVESFNFAGIV